MMHRKQRPPPTSIFVSRCLYQATNKLTLIPNGPHQPIYTKQRQLRPGKLWRGRLRPGHERLLGAHDGRHVRPVAHGRHVEPILWGRLLARLLLAWLVWFLWWWLVGLVRFVGRRKQPVGCLCLIVGRSPGRWRWNERQLIEQHLRLIPEQLYERRLHALLWPPKAMRGGHNHHHD